jgi:hypothetical protein
MLMLVLALAASAPAEEPARADLCLAYINTMIAEASRESGRVAGPSWFIRDWWAARLPPEGDPLALSTEQREALEASMPRRQDADPEAYRAGLQSCVDEAIEGGALP